jgi:hypothetical protein
MADVGNNVLRQFLDAGFVQLSQVIDKDTVEGFVEQIRDELASTSKVEKERSIGCVVLADKSTWPQGKKRRVVECAPAGVGAHWEKLKSASKFCDALDEIVGPSCWELPFNKLQSNDNDDESAKVPPVRHWYFPITFPETFYNNNSATLRPTGETDQVPSHPHLALLRSNREELQIDGPFTNEEVDAPTRWQPVSRRRVRGKGWHLDSGPGFGNDDVRTSIGHPYQCVVVLLLLSDCLPGGGGTCLYPYSHKLVQKKLREVGNQGMTHHELNTWCVSEMKDLIQRGKISLVPGGIKRFNHRQEGAAPQIIGRAGDVVLMHPLLIHSGTTNLRPELRLMGNGMVRMKKEVFERRGGVCFMRPE